MADDLVTRLRKIAPIHKGRKGHDCIEQAAGEIERLRAELSRRDYFEWICPSCGVFVSSQVVHRHD